MTKLILAAVLTLASIVGLGSFPFISPYVDQKQCETIGQIKLDPAISIAEAEVDFAVKVTNCSPLKQTYRVVGIEEGICDIKRGIGDGSVELAPGETVSLTAVMLGAPSVCPGPVKVLVVVFSDGKEIARRETVLGYKPPKAQTF